MSLENFKNFVRIRPILASYVNNGNASWQQLYELYTMYGENSTVWDKYLYKNSNSSNNYINNTNTITLKDLFGYIKNIDVSELQKTIISVQKGLGYLENLAKTKEKEDNKPVYESRPLYKYFDD